AVKYTGIGGKIQITVSEYSLFTRIDIQDNGIGIAESDLPKIFGRFYKCSTTKQEEGVGLGLYLAREIISGQGGYIKVNSQIEKGTVFSVFLRRSI
ncbi:MAG: sensor histidine kinase, partial [Lachnospiraceae bacterium]|nr:sensor histidine kinase [Lachnospiraceae bacterium]